MKTKINLMMKNLLLATLLLLGMHTSAQVNVTSSHSAAAMAQMMAGAGVSISNAAYNGTCDSSTQAGKFFVTAATPFGLSDSGILLTSGQTAIATGVSAVPSFNTTFAGDADLAILSAPQASFDACVLEFDFVPLGDTVKFKYVFASAEYQTYSCSIADVFGFFISGPGITGTFSNSSQNIALLPNGCYVGVNTVNGQTSNPCGNAGAACSPPNNTLFYSNLPTGNTTTGIAYNGFTVPLTAIAVVTPCSTYHLKLAISDASDHILDSGVFLEAGSLTSNAIAFTPFSLLNLPDPYLVEGCAPGGIVVTRPVAGILPYVVNYTIGGTATNGVDYATLSGTVTIPAGQNSATIPIIALTDGLTEGGETVIIKKQAACSTNILDSVVFFIFDKIRMKILTSDTNICQGKPMQIITEADSNLSFVWTPNININNNTLQNPMVTPFASTAYIVTATLANSGCAPVKDTINITTIPGPTVNIGPDITICKNMTHQFNPTITPVQAYTYTWGGDNTSFLSSTSIVNPIATMTTVGTFRFWLITSPNALGCNGFDTMIIKVLPNDFTLFSTDTTICDGNSVQAVIFGPNEFKYQWSPNTFISNDTIKNPLLSPPVTTTYNCTATYPGCPNMNHDFTIKVEPVPTVNAGADRVKCYYDTVRLEAMVTPSTFSPYVYNWNPALGLNNSSTTEVTFNGFTSTTFTFTATTPNGCVGSDAVAVVVHPKSNTLATANIYTICPSTPVNLTASGAINYLWQPSFGIADSTAPITVANPVTSQTYTLYTTDINNCKDTAYVELIVASNAVLNLGPDVNVYPGQTYQFTPSTNCLTFTWLPTSFLDFTNIANPTVSNGTASTQYTVTATTEYNCTTVDTVIVTFMPNSLITLANAFTPGSGTSINDEFKANYLGIAKLNSFKIFNRWGQLVFETNDINKGWNGRFKDVPQPMGTYVYQIDATTDGGKPFTKSGNITLIR
jgi:gliding motility-associated-like protein